MNTKQFKKSCGTGELCGTEGSRGTGESRGTRVVDDRNGSCGGGRMLNNGDSAEQRKGGTANRKTKHKDNSRLGGDRRRSGGRNSSLNTKLVTGFLFCLLFTYQKISLTTFTLLNCVPVEGERVLYVDGTITCYQYWQYGVSHSST